jgi:DNA-binding NarL/FixJ family response regulator
MKVEHRKLSEQPRPARRVLVVDDHPSFRRCATAMLTAEGFDVVGEVEDGASALAAVAEQGPELVLLDIQLPDLDGFEVARRLLADDPELRIVLISSRDRSQYGSLVDASGVLGFVCKDDLTGAALERLLG